MTPQRFSHILRMTNEFGTFEHADHTTPRVEHGYCTDDMARVLIAVCREPDPTEELVALGRVAYRFLDEAQSAVGLMRNRRNATGRWEDRPAAHDCWGRGLWAFGTAARGAPDPWMRQAARSSFHTGCQQRSPWPRAMAFAALGASEILTAHPDEAVARELLTDAVRTIGAPTTDDAWPWPEPRLTYANAVIPEALLVAGTHLERPSLLADGLRLLGWLLERETVDGHLSPVPVGGAGPSEHAHGFDQQPIEIATIADACRMAATVSADDRWVAGIDRAVAWFHGDNDLGAPMIDLASGGGYDGLTPTGPNLNCGAESTLAMITTLQVGDRLAMARG